MSHNKKIRVIPVILGHDAQNSGFLAMGMLMAYVRVWKEGYLGAFLDFGGKLKAYATRIPDELDAWLQVLKANPEPAIYMFSSFEWTHDMNIKAATFIREFSPDSLIIFGGAQIPRAEIAAHKFMRDYPVMDVGVLGEGEETLAYLFEQIAEQSCVQGKTLREVDFSSVIGLIFRKPDNSTVWTNTRDQIRNLDSIPSPYLEGLFDDSIYDLTLITETNRGCPFGCTFCDWGGATLSKVRKFDIERVRKEIELFAQKKINLFTFADSNFGALKRDVDITDMVIDVHRRTGYPKQVYMSLAKNATERVVTIMSKLYDCDMIKRVGIAFQTMDQTTLNNIDRGNIRTSHYEVLLETLRKKGVPLTTDTLIGLPGQNVGTLAADLENYFNWNVYSFVALVCVLPNAPMADPEYQKKFKMKVSDDGFVVASSSYDEAEWRKMIRFRLAEYVSVHEKFLRYLLYYLQIEHKVPAMDVLMAMLQHADTGALAHKYPLLMRYMTRMQNWNTDDTPSFMLPSWTEDDSQDVLQNLDDFYAQFLAFVHEHFEVVLDPLDRESLVGLQIMMIDKVNRSLPADKDVPRDVVSYFNQLVPVVSVNKLPPEFRRLSDFPAAKVVVPKQAIKRNYRYTKTYVKQMEGEWPLAVEGLVF